MRRLRYILCSTAVRGVVCVMSATFGHDNKCVRTEEASREAGSQDSDRSSIGAKDQRVRQQRRIETGA